MTWLTNSHTQSGTKNKPKENGRVGGATKGLAHDREVSNRREVSTRQGSKHKKGSKHKTGNKHKTGK